MKPSIILSPFLLLILFSCSNSTENPNFIKIDSNENFTGIDSIVMNTSIYYTDSNKLNLQIDSTLTQKEIAFSSDSAVAFDYIGFERENSFPVINKKGQWINTIKQSKKLSDEQFKLIYSVFENKNSFQNTLIIGCYEPRLGIVYFKNGTVIGQSAICIDCARLESSARLGNGENYSSFNKRALRQLEKICKQLKFSDCDHLTD